MGQLQAERAQKLCEVKDIEDEVLWARKFDKHCSAHSLVSSIAMLDARIKVVLHRPPSSHRSSVVRDLNDLKRQLKEEALRAADATAAEGAHDVPVSADVGRIASWADEQEAPAADTTAAELFSCAGEEPESPSQFQPEELTVSGAADRLRVADTTAAEGAGTGTAAAAGARRPGRSRKARQKPTSMGMG